MSLQAEVQYDWAAKVVKSAVLCTLYRQVGRPTVLCTLYRQVGRPVGRSWHHQISSRDVLNMLGLGSGTIRRCELVGVGEALWEEVCHRGRGL
jgi:hypothetical protein